jgi:EAL domain-containing protein (putative c-di-GMP-specific phosphodiesterase class I)
MEQGKPFSATDSPLVDFDAVCQKVRAAVEPARAHAVSLHDHNGDVLWLSESSMGPDEHNAVREALDTFAKGGPPIVAVDLGDARSALLLRAVSARRALVGVIMIILDTRMIKQDERGAVRMMTPRLQRALADFAAMRPDIEPPPQATPAVSPVKSAPLPSGKPPPAKGVFAELKPAEIGMSTRAPVPPRGAAAGTAAARSTPTPATARAPAGRPHTERPPLPTNRAPDAKARAASPTPQRSAAPAPFPPHAPSSATPSPPAPSGPVYYGREPSPIELALAEAVPPSARKSTATSSAFISARAATAPPDAVLLEPAPSAVEGRAPIAPEIDRLHAALRKSPIALHVQHLVPLAKGSQLKRYEVLLRSKGEDAPNVAPQAMLRAAVDNGLGSMIDRRVVTELIGWLVHHPDVWQSTPVMFSVNLTATALQDEHFIKFIELCLAKSSLPAATIAFELEVSTAAKLSSRVFEVAEALHRLGCPMVLDDFALRTECFDMLRMPGVRYVKLSSDITAKMRTDKFSQASITAVVQMARVLGMHTVAKRTETPAEQEWLTALGVDFVQSHALSPPTLIDSLSRGPSR